MSPNPHISAVVISRNEGRRLRDTVENLDDTLPGHADIAVVDDGSTDGSTRFLGSGRKRRVRLFRDKGLGVARARNLGARRSKGDVLVFADAHIALQPDWWRPLVDLLENPRVGAAAPAVADLLERRCIGFGLTLPKPTLIAQWIDDDPGKAHAVPILPGCSMAMRRDTFAAAGGHDESLLASGCVDNEICVRLWLLGYQLWVTPETVVRHHFRRRSPYSLGWWQVLHNRLRLAMIHLKPARIGKVLAALSSYSEFARAVTRVTEGNVDARRAQLLSQRLKNDDWFFDRFGLEW